MLDPQALHDWLIATLGPFYAEIQSPWFYLQFGLILIAVLIAAAVSAVVTSRGAATAGASWPSSLRRPLRRLLLSSGTIVFAVLTLAMRDVVREFLPPHHTYMLMVAAKFALAWLIIRLAASLIRNNTAVRLVSISAWAVAALSILGWLDPVIDALDSVAVIVGGIRLTPLLVIKATVFLVLALWLAGLISRFLETRIDSSRDLTPSLQVLLSKIIRIGLMVLAVIIVMAAVGIDVSSLAIFSGAIGVGLGFGLQKIVGNFISGIILLTDKSVKPGDLVTVGDSFGRISNMKTRYIAVDAGDGREILIPNEDLITQKVVNWTYTDRTTLVKIAFATTYDADPRAICKLAIDIAAATPRVMAEKPPSCLLSEFGENGMKFALTCWVANLDAGTDNVKSAILATLWDTFRRENIRMPVPMRDIRLQDARTPDEPTAPRSDA